MCCETLAALRWQCLHGWCCFFLCNVLSPQSKVCCSHGADTPLTLTVARLRRQRVSLANRHSDFPCYSKQVFQSARPAFTEPCQHRHLKQQNSSIQVEGTCPAVQASVVRARQAQAVRGSRSTANHLHQHKPREAQTVRNAAAASRISGNQHPLACLCCYLNCFGASSWIF